MSRRIRISFDNPLPLDELAAGSASPFAAFQDIISTGGELNFKGKASIDSNGIQFQKGTCYHINMSEIKVQHVLGKGQYGVVQKVLHLPTQTMMAMKEIRLELSKAKLDTIIMELGVLNQSKSEFIIDFFGAFYIESCVYICTEYMDGGSIDFMYQDGIPEQILTRISLSIVKGLNFLKSELNIIHRDVKPSNILINTKGQVKLCDFGVSGQLIQSIAKTNVGCQSYMAPERIMKKRGVYDVKSDVWSFGVTVVEMAQGYYPFALDFYDSVFAQLNAICLGPAPKLPDSFSIGAQQVVSACLLKDPAQRPSYIDLLDSPWLSAEICTEEEVSQWVCDRLKKKNNI